MTISGRTWSWVTVNGLTVLSTTTPDTIYVELGVRAGDTQADLALLEQVAKTLG